MKILRNGPFFLLIAMVVGALLFQVIARNVRPLRKIEQSTTLRGVNALSAPPPLSVQNLDDHKIQNWAEKKLPEYLPFRDLIVRTSNQILYSVFSKSYMGGDNPLIVGKEGYLYSISYLQSYCDSQSWTIPTADVKAWAAELAEISRWLDSQGKTLIFMTTPSKAVYYSEYLPDAFHCTGPRLRAPFKRAMSDLYATNTVRIVNGAELIYEQKGKFDVELFPRGGIHVNQVGSAILVNGLLDKINESRGTHIKRLSLAHERAKRPNDIDDDLAQLLNVLWPPTDYPTANLLWEGSREQPTPSPLKVNFIGGSFLTVPSRLLNGYNIFSPFIRYFYTAVVVKYPGEEVVPADASTMDEIFKSDVIVIECNEEAPVSLHSRMFIKEAYARMAKTKS
jgi:hypothetical protein